MLVVGLGNPGAGYAGNRHNVGAMALHRIAAQESATLKRGRGRLSRVATAVVGLDGCRAILATLTTYMNESGQAVAPLLDYYKSDPGSLVVIHDELDLPFGTIRIKQGGGDNGHNGLRSITRSVGSRDYLRIRIGIGRPIGPQLPADFVLSDFSAGERGRLPMLLDEVSYAVTLLCGHGVSYAQNEIH